MKLILLALMILLARAGAERNGDGKNKGMSDDIRLTRYHDNLLRRGDG